MSNPEPSNALEDRNRLQELAGLDQDKSELADISRDDFDDIREFVEFVTDQLSEKPDSSADDLMYEVIENIDSDELWEALDKVAKKNKLYYYADKE